MEILQTVKNVGNSFFVSKMVRKWTFPFLVNSHVFFILAAEKVINILTIPHAKCE